MTKEIQLYNEGIDMDSLTKQAEIIVKARICGVSTIEQAMSLMLMSLSEGLPATAFAKRYHIVEGRMSMRADTMQAEFEKNGGKIIWHVRSDDECAATFVTHGDLKDAVERSIKRYQHAKVIHLADLNALDENNPEAQAGIRNEAINSMVALSYPGEVTVIRTKEEAWRRKFGQAWDKEKKEWRWKDIWTKHRRAMLHARTISEGIRATMPGVIAGVYTEEEIHSFSDESSPAQQFERSVESVNQQTDDKEVSYYVEKGYSKEEAEAMVSDDPEKWDSIVTNGRDGWIDFICIGPSSIEGRAVGSLSKNHSEVALKWAKMKRSSDPRPSYDAYIAALEQSIKDGDPFELSGDEAKKTSAS